VIFAAIYGLRALQRILFDQLDQPQNIVLNDLSRREFAVMTAFAVAIIWLGVAPAPILDRLDVLPLGRSLQAMTAPGDATPSITQALVVGR
jgi:NADH:ubiquinone oxidoreductase subunit 4 (subunit M)